MIGFELLETGIFLGVLTLLAGCYGILYSIGKVADWRAMRLAGFACYGFQCVLALAIVGFSPLTVPWKLVVIVGTLGFLGIPPIAWHFVERTHETEAHT